MENAIVYQASSIWMVPELLSAQECKDLIYFSEFRGFEEATVSLASGPQMMKGVRNNYRLVIEDEDLAQKIWERAAQYCPSAIDGRPLIGLNPRFRFYRYEPGQRFKKHRDGRVKLDDRESRLTFMIYLNEGYEGGETHFEAAKIIPRTGSALFFIHELRHESIPLVQGTKYVLRSDIFYAS